MAPCNMPPFFILTAVWEMGSSSDGGLEDEADSQLVVEPESNPGVSDHKDPAHSAQASSTRSSNGSVVPGARETEIKDTGMVLVLTSSGSRGS